MLSLDPYHVTLILTAIITGIISPIVVNVSKFLIFKTRKKNICEISRNLHIEDHITKKLETIRDYSDVDRVWIAEFHNGGHTFTGRSMQKFSMTYEVVKNGISLEGANTQNLPTSLFSTFFKKVADKGVFVVSAEVEEYIAMKSFLESRGIQSLVSFVIKNLENETIGVLCLDKVKRDFEINNTIIEKIQDDVNIISGNLESLLRK